ncbi:5-oxoprolinase subunit C family protein [Salinactinospora qingdaonensis]|uniref:Biotin-dependent carboxyltransferase family protein n=1 Tax=Salinactinospora qingdaonensis TaxID=702744 RepID=A0ABP7EYP6_9ACTN
MRALEVLDTGPLTTVQDSGRHGHAALGVGVSGAADPPAFALANRMVANPAGAAALEVTLGGLRARALSDLTIAITGATSTVTIDGRAAALHSVLPLPSGSHLRLGRPERGLRTYVAVRGGVAVDPVLGSRSTDTLAALGPAPLTPGTVLPVGPAPHAWPVTDLAPVAPPPGEDIDLRVTLGPRDDWFHDEAIATLLSRSYQVSDQCDRVGIRLIGPHLPRRHTGELPSEGMVPGALQVPPSGQPVLFLADHPVTGGYPVIAVVRSADVGHAAQARPGARLRFHASPRHISAQASG